MSDHPDSESLETLRRAVERLPTPEIGSWDAFLALVSTLGPAGALFTQWQSLRRQRETWTRCIDVLSQMAVAIEHLETAGKTCHLSDSFAELITEILPFVARTRSEKKRRHFAYLLANGATRESDEERDEGRTMAILLDQLEYEHVRVFSEVLRAPMTQNYHGLWHGIRSVDSRAVENRGEHYGSALLRLQGLGLLTIGESERQSGAFSIEVNSLGISLYYWTTIDES